MKKIKVVLADDNENIRQSIRGLLELDGEIDVIAEATDGKDVLEKIKTMEPEIVVMDVNMPGIDGIEATEYITLNHPNIYVVMISVDDNIQNFKKAMMAGAKEYLIKPLSPQEFNDTVKKVAELGRKNTARNQAEPPGPKVPLKENRIITVFGTKGGVGKSTICANVAVTAAEKGRAGKIAIVDLDIQFGDISVMMNINPRKTISELMQEGENLNRELFEGFLYERYGVNIMPSTNKPELAELVTSHGVHKILEICKDMHEYTFVDTPSFIDDITLTALEMSQVILLMITLDLPTIKNVKKGIDILRSLNLLPRTKLILNRSTGMAGIEPRDVEKVLDMKIMAEVPSDGKLVLSSINQGIPFIKINPKAPISKGINKVLHVAMA